MRKLHCDVIFSSSLENDAYFCIFTADKKVIKKRCRERLIMATTNRLAREY